MYQIMVWLGCQRILGDSGTPINFLPFCNPSPNALRTQPGLRLRGLVLRLLPALANAMATACLIAFFFVGGWLVPIDPSFSHSSTSILILLLTADRPDPFLSGMLYLLSAELSGRAFLLDCHSIKLSPKTQSSLLRRGPVTALGKNFLNGKNNPVRLKTIININGKSNDDCDAEGRVKLRAIQARK